MNYNFFADWLKRLPFTRIANYTEECEALVHFTEGALWSASFAHLCRYSPWLFLTAFGWIGLVLHKELIKEEHWKRIKDKTETEEQRKDLISDIVTKLMGLVFYGLAFI